MMQVTDDEKTDNFDFIEAITQYIDILDKVLGYLNYSDLCNCECINNVWNERVNAILRKRIAPNYFILPSNDCYHDELYSRPNLCIVFLLAGSDPLKLNSYMISPYCVHDKTPVQKKLVIEIVEDDILLNTKCPLIALSCLSTEFKTIKSRANGIIFPHIPNVKISVFRLKTEKLSVFDEIIEKHIGKDNKLSCLLAFGENPKKLLLKKFINHLGEKHSMDRYAFGGGIVVGQKSFNCDKFPSGVIKRHEVLCASFSIPKNGNVPFNAYSIIIPEDATSQEDMESSIVKFKNNVSLRQYSVAFQIICSSRDQLEIPLVRAMLWKHFPDLEVLGFAGYGEIGWNCFEQDNENSEPVQKKPKSTPDIFNQFSIVIVLLTWGKLRKT